MCNTSCNPELVHLLNSAEACRVSILNGLEEEIGFTNQLPTVEFKVDVGEMPAMKEVRHTLDPEVKWVAAIAIAADGLDGQATHVSMGEPDSCALGGEVAATGPVPGDSEDRKGACKFALPFPALIWLPDINQGPEGEECFAVLFMDLMDVQAEASLGQSRDALHTGMAVAVSGDATVAAANGMVSVKTDGTTTDCAVKVRRDTPLGHGSTGGEWVALGRSEVTAVSF